MRIGLVDLFSGAGGLSAGFRDQGFDVVASVESVATCSRTHALNFPGCHAFNTDIRALDPGDILETVRRKGPFDALVVAGGPPCQSFSTIGRPKIRSLKVTGLSNFESDHRDYLFLDFFRVVELLQPSVFLMENVPSLRTTRSGQLYRECLRLVGELGYAVSPAVLNAAQYGVPQTRRRLFLVGTKGASFAFPSPTHTGDTEDATSYGRGFDSCLPTVTVGEAISDLPEIFDGIRAGQLPYSKALAENRFQEVVRSPSGTVGNNICRVSNDRAKRVFPHLMPGAKYMDLPPEIRRILPFREDIFFDRLKRLHPDRPSWTVIAHIGMDGYMYIHPWENRTLSVREAARLQSFSDDFQFTGNMREQYVEVGNAVPPLLASALARAVRGAVDQQKSAA
ncbi:MAG: Modification methylase BspRI [Nitrospira sp.]|nr:Modification methylase BspRI [Nitrospira sp.]